jgi:ribosome maturation factor RimP
MSTAGVEDWSEWRGKYVTLTLNTVGSSSDSNITGRVFTVSKEWNALVIQSETRVVRCR